jgi:hypothetical protein
MGCATGHYGKEHDLPPVAGKRTGRAVWPSTEDTDWWGSFKPRSDAESEPDKEEF